MSGDFFSSVPVRRPASDDQHDDFAHAIAARFGAADIRTARLPQQPAHAPSRPAPTLPAHHPFSPVPPSALAAFLDEPRALVLDIRPHAAHAAARINDAISLSVPTTLLKRPLFSLSKLSMMLPSPSSRARFADWSSASRILVYDSDSLAAPDNSIIAGLLRKFHAEGFTGELAWVRGGFQAVWKETRHLATTDRPLPEEEDADPASSSGALRASHLPKAAFSLSSTTVAPPHHPSHHPSLYPLPNTPAPSASRAANPFFDTIRQNIELSHGVTERIPLRLPRRVRRRIHDLPFPWLRDIAHRSALRHTSASRHPGLDTFESGSESSDDPHTSDPDDNDQHVEEGAEALAMQFYRIELAEQRRLRSIMEHHTKESEPPSFASPNRPRRSPGKGTLGVGTGLAQSSASIRPGAKSVPGTPYPAPFPFSITAGVEKGTKNRYTHIWPFEHARVRLHDGRHQGSHMGRRDKGKFSERGRRTRDQAGGKEKEKGEQAMDQRRSRSSPAYGKSDGQEAASSRYLYPSERSSITGTGIGREVELAFPALNGGPGVPQVKIEYDITEQDCRISGPSTPATALPFPTPPFYTPMEISPTLTPMRGWPPQSITLPSSVSVSPGARLGGTKLALPASPSFPLRLPNRPGGFLPSIGEQTWTSELLSPSDAPLADNISGTTGEGFDTGMKRELRREPSPADDYVNASYVQPLGTRKRYIATQGPLPSTYVDFWTLVWEQNVHVIVMLTREVENAMVKCGSYWTDAEYGPLRLQLLSTSPPMSPGGDTSVDISMQGFFAIREPQEKTSSTSRDQPTLITRVFSLTHTSYSGVPPRRITHLQYLDWSDMNVPDDPRGVLDLISKLEHVVAECTPGPSPSGSLSPGSASGSPSGSQSPDTGQDQNGYSAPLLSPTSAGFTPRGGRRRGSEWRHPELDPKTGIAAFALGRTPPVLLHCSAGVGRTGGFIAVDAVLDGIRRELRKSREERSLMTVSGACVVMGLKDKADVDGVNASGDLSFDSTEAETKSAENSGRESTPDGSKRMDVDEPVVDRVEPKAQDPLHMINTVPIHVSAGERPKGRRHHYHNVGPSSEQIRSSSESLVVHVPCVETGSVPEESNSTGIDLGDPNEAGWQSSSTREWAERVSDQTHAHVGKRDHPPPPPLTPSGRERSPGSSSTSSGPSATNSADDYTNGSVSGNASGSASGSGNDMEWKSSTGSMHGSGTGSGSGSGSGHPPTSSVSKLGSGSVSLSCSGSGSGSGSRLGSSLMRVRLRDSSVTSISAESSESLSLGHGSKSNSLDMDVDHPPRPVPAPLRPTSSDKAGPQDVAQPQTMLVSSPVASLSSPVIAPTPTGASGAFGGNAAKGSASQRSSASPPRAFASGKSADAEGSGKKSQEPSDESEALAVKSKPRSNLQVNTELSSLRLPGTFYTSYPAEGLQLLSKENRGRNRITIPPVSLVLDDSAPQQHFPTHEHDQRNVDYPVIDYKLPRQLHSDLSPPLISSFSEPICTVIQDMREQRMSLCQSLRQYVFVHAAIIEGALRIVDEERELWGSVGTSKDASPGEVEPGTGIKGLQRRSGHSEGPAPWFDVMTPELDHRDIAHRIHPYPIVSQPVNHYSSDVEIGQSQVPPAPASCSSSVSSPSKGKRGPSPTELPREDKTGALSLNKRPSIHRQMTQDEGNPLVIGSSRSLTVGDNGDGSRDAGVGMYATRPAPGRLGAPETGAFTSNQTIFD